MALSNSVKIVPLFTAIVLALSSSSHAQNAAAYVISDSITGFILDQSNGAKKLPIASLTKIATAMVVLDWSDSTKTDLSQLATVPGSAAQIATAQGVGLQPGDGCSMRDLL